MQVIQASHVFDSSAEVAEAVCRDILQHAEEAIQARGRFKLVLAGGTTPEQIYRLLAKASASWKDWHIYYGDERCLPVDHPDRNSVMAQRAWLEHVTIPVEQIYTMPTELGPEAAKQAYAALMSEALPFDMVLLGMGEDGHTASLFPGQRHDLSEFVHAVYNSPKPPPERISLSAAALSTCQRLLFIITGVGKRSALMAWRSGELLPVATILPQKGVVIYGDKAALD